MAACSNGSDVSPGGVGRKWKDRGLVPGWTLTATGSAVKGWAHGGEEGGRRFRSRTKRRTLINLALPAEAGRWNLDGPSACVELLITKATGDGYALSGSPNARWLAVGPRQAVVGRCSGVTVCRWRRKKRSRESETSAESSRKWRWDVRAEKCKTEHEVGGAVGIRCFAGSGSFRFGHEWRQLCRIRKDDVERKGSRTKPDERKVTAENG